MKYLLAYSIPLICLLGIYFHGLWSYTVVLYVFVLIPILEHFLPLDSSNYSKSEEESRLKNKLYDGLLYLNIPIVYGCMYFTYKIVQSNELTYFEFIGITISLGIILGSNGINVAHELGHRKKLYERIFGKILLIPSHYTHFFIEHNHGHHIHVSTPQDPSTAKYNQNLYQFWIQSVTGTYVKAWQIQKKLNRIENTSLFSVRNDMFWFTIIQLCYLTALFFVFGLKVLLVGILS